MIAIFKPKFWGIAFAFVVFIFLIKTDAYAATAVVSAATGGVDNRFQQQAKQALLEGKYDYAILLLSKLRKQGNEKQKIFAQEYIGVARERKGQRAFARDEYRRFLKEYPKVIEAERVKQRLNAILGLDNIASVQTLKKGKTGRKKQTDGWSNFGSLSGNYRYSATVDDAGNSRDSLSLLSADLDFTTRMRTEDYEMQIRFSGGHYEDLLDDGSATTQRLRYLYVDAATSDDQYKLRLGRQRSRSGGVIGRFDGLLGSYQFSDDLSINMVTGFPVDSSRNTSIDSERDFFGASIDIKDVWEHYDFNIFAIQQNIGSLVDRQAMGGEVRYLSDLSSIFALVDYDTQFQELNALVVNGNHRLENNSRLNWSVNIRKSPYISTRNALIGQPADSIQELQLLFLTEDEILDLAQDRTLESKSASVLYSFAYNEEVNLSGSLTWLNLSDSPASGGVPAFTSSGNQFYLDFQATTRNLIFDKDTSFAGIRYSELNTSSIFSVYANSRIPWKKFFTLTPRIRFDVRDNKNGSSQWNVTPSVKIQYQEKSHIVFAETGLVYFQTAFPDLETQTTSIYYFYMGYRYAW
jgi:hypothetical protein